MHYDERGFTLLETILVMMIVALTMAVITPSIQAVLKDHHLYSSARQVAWTLRAARQEAIYQGRDVNVRFYVSNDTYLWNDSRFHLLGSTEFEGVPNFPTEIGRVPACIFQASGRPRTGGTVVLEGDHQRLYVIVSSVAGRIRISPSPPASW